jgi:Flp pilus assembly protein TadG
MERVMRRRSAREPLSRVKLFDHIGNLARDRRGSVLVLASMLLLVAGMSLSAVFDLSRLYFARNTAQIRADAAALAAVLPLDGTHEGLERAREAATQAARQASPEGNPSSGLRVEFADSSNGIYREHPPTAENMRFVRVVCTTYVPFTLLRTFVPQNRSHAWAGSTAMQGRKVHFESGLFPYAVLAHGETRPHFGLTQGERYALHWPEQPSLAAKNVCSGDASTATIARATANNMKGAGFIELVSANNVRRTILTEYQSSLRRIGDPLTFHPGLRHFEIVALNERISQDRDFGAVTYDEYTRRGEGNGRRLVAVPIHSGYPKYQFLEVGAFFLLPATEYREHGDDALCAEYVGPYMLGSTRRGAAETGFYAAALVR